jgi:prenyltransferase beta subunit
MDSCYSYWNKGTLQLLNLLHLINTPADSLFIEECFTDKGGFSKYNFVKSPDILHTMYSICALSLSEKEGIKKVNALLGITEDSFK